MTLNVSKVAELLKSMTPEEINSQDKFGFTALHAAVSHSEGPNDKIIRVSYNLSV
jgi:hypothetical protein